MFYLLLQEIHGGFIISWQWCPLQNKTFPKKEDAKLCKTVWEA